MLDEEKKTDRKKKRFAARLRSSKGIICTDKLNRNIVLCNVGKASGLMKEDVHNLIRSTLPNLILPKLIAEKGETHSFLVFHSDEEAALFYKECNGKSKLCGTPIYMNYVENVPNLEVVCNSHDPPKGLHILNDFITPAEEEMFLKLFDFKESNKLKNRQVKHYGYEFRYGSNDVDLTAPLEQAIPKECDVLWQRLAEQGVEVEVPDQLTVNKYEPGQGIPSHVDKHSPFGDTIMSLSLGSSVVMDWRHPSGKFVPVAVPARSLLIMQDEARYAWRHGIQARRCDPPATARAARTSLTFRRARPAGAGACACAHPALCDRPRQQDADADDDDEAARRLEDLHVHQVYEKIADHFSMTRHKPWPRVVEFMLDVPSGSVVVDLGSGNGKNLLPRPDILQIAGERSGGLLSACAARLRRVRAAAAGCVRLQLGAAPLPLREACADAVLCVAVLHHFSTRPRRLAALRSVHSVLRRGGRALLTVWARDQARAHSHYLRGAGAAGGAGCVKDAGAAGYAGNAESAGNACAASHTVHVAGRALPVHQNRTQFRHQDLLVPWKLRDASRPEAADPPLLRYYHVFEEGELDGLCEEVGFLVEKSFYEEGNWCVICIKK